MEATMMNCKNRCTSGYGLGILVNLLVCFIFLADFAKADYVSGDQYGTWTSGHSSYYVIGDILVPDNSSLIIQPGCQVLFQGNYAFTVNGTLIAEAADFRTDPV